MSIPWSHEGRIARMNGKTIEENPYAFGMSSFNDWKKGWKQADKAYKEYVKNNSKKYCPHCGQEVNYG